MLRNDNIQQKEKGTIFMGLYTFMSGVQFLGWCPWEGNQCDK